MNKDILPEKGKQTKDMVDMEEYAWGLKVDRILKLPSLSISLSSQVRDLHGIRFVTSINLVTMNVVN